MVQSKNFKTLGRKILIYTVIVLAGLICLLPLIHTVSLSFSSAHAARTNQVGLWPVEFTLVAYESVVNDSLYFRTFFNSVVISAMALLVQIPVTVMMAYPLSRSEKQFRGRGVYMGIMLFAMMFNAGLIPTYLVIKELGLINTWWSLVICVPMGNVILMMNFFKGVPHSLEEAAIIDGANPIQIMLKVMLPISKASVATVTLFSFVGIWNAWFGGMVYITKNVNRPLMTYIQSLDYDVTKLIDSGATEEQIARALQLSGKNFNAAKIVIAVVPLMLVYPFVQRHLLTGITVGAVKE